jgi:hypothetical protein
MLTKLKGWGLIFIIVIGTILTIKNLVFNKNDENISPVENDTVLNQAPKKDTSDCGCPADSIISEVRAYLKEEAEKSKLSTESLPAFNMNKNFAIGTLDKDNRIIVSRTNSYKNLSSGDILYGQSVTDSTIKIILIKKQDGKALKASMTGYVNVSKKGVRGKKVRIQ